ncbi:MAG: hypothetical protein ACTS1Z_14485 [Parasphingopyxis sp.]|uniref:hypothetical protein n=1 Tax=Parasphingopyxis sp. TaxID=1920299 RepID=UPI003F9EF03D
MAHRTFALRAASASLAIGLAALVTPAPAQADDGRNIVLNDPSARELLTMDGICSAEGHGGFDREDALERYGRFYREVRATRDALRENAENADNAAARDEYLEQYRQYDQFLSAFRHPSDHPCDGGRAVLTQAFGGAPEEAIPDPVSMEEFLEFHGWVGESGVPQTGIGFRREGAPGQAPEGFGAAIDSVLRFRAQGRVRSDGLEVFFGYSDGDGETSALIPGGGGIDSGTVYGDLSPGGSSGIATPFGLDAQTRVEVTEWSVGGAVRVYQWNSGSVAGQVWGRGSYTHSDRNYFGQANGSGTQNGFTFEFGQTREQFVDEDFFELGVGSEVRARLADPLFATIMTELGIYVRDSSLESTETNSNNFTGPPDGNFSLNIEDSQSGIGFHGRAEAGLDLHLGSGFSIGIFGDVEYRSDVGAIFNPNSGDQVFSTG